MESETEYPCRSACSFHSLATTALANPLDCRDIDVSISLPCASAAPFLLTFFLCMCTYDVYPLPLKPSQSVRDISPNLAAQMQDQIAQSEHLIYFQKVLGLSPSLSIFPYTCSLLRALQHGRTYLACQVKSFWLAASNWVSHYIHCFSYNTA